MDRIARVSKYVDFQGEICTGNVRSFPAYFDEEKGYLFWPRKSHAKMFAEVPFPAEMTHDEIGKMTVLSKHIWSNTNMLAYRGNGGVKPYSIERIGQVIGLRRSQAHAFLSKMISLGLIAKADTKVAEHTDTYYYLSPLYYFASNRIPLHLYMIFRRQLDDVLPMWVIQRYAECNPVALDVKTQ